MKKHEKYEDKDLRTVLPQRVIEEIDKLGLYRIMKNKALKLVSILILKGMYDNHDLSIFIPLAANYFEKTFNKEYHTDFLNKMKAANIIECNELYKQGSRFSPNNYNY